MFDSVSAIVMCTLIWTMHYFLLRYIIQDKSAEFCNRLITLAHGCSVACLGINQCFSGEVSPIYTPHEPSTNMERFILLWSLGYFIFDLGWCVVYQTETPLMISHHMFSVVALWRMLMKETSGGQATCCLGAMEITNPFLQGRWFVRTFGYHKTSLFNSMEIMYVLLFLFIRVGIGTFYLLVVLTYGSDLDYVVLAIVMYVISWLFILKIVNFMLAKYKELLRQWQNIASASEETNDGIPSHT